jgi:hypothetical protein
MKMMEPALLHKAVGTLAFRSVRDAVELTYCKFDDAVPSVRDEMRKMYHTDGDRMAKVLSKLKLLPDDVSASTYEACGPKQTQHPQPQPGARVADSLMFDDGAGAVPQNQLVAKSVEDKRARRTRLRGARRSLSVGELRQSLRRYLMTTTMMMPLMVTMMIMILTLLPGLGVPRALGDSCTVWYPHG